VLLQAASFPGWLTQSGPKWVSVPRPQFSTRASGLHLASSAAVLGRGRPLTRV
jgi:hypothetical protein